MDWKRKWSGWRLVGLVAYVIFAATVWVIVTGVLLEDAFPDHGDMVGYVTSAAIAALLTAGGIAINMFLSGNDKREIIESQEKLNDGLKKELKGVSARLETMESLLREIRDEMRMMREEMRMMREEMGRAGAHRPGGT